MPASPIPMPRPPYDPELLPVLDAMAAVVPPTLTPDMIVPMRTAAPTPPIDELIAGRPIEHTERVIPGPEGAPDITVSVFVPRDHRAGGVGIYNVHGGGMISGDRFTAFAPILELVDELDAVAVTVEYRLAPENPDPAPVEDSYAGLVWTAAHAQELGFDAGKLVIAGASAGGGIAAGVALLARDRSGPPVAAQLLIYPMLDDRNETVSSHQFVGIGIWDRGSNDTGWNALLGDRRNTDEVSIYAAPGRAMDLSGLPTTYIECGSAEVFRDEDVAYASRLWASGTQAELHVWPGAFHGVDALVPQAAISRCYFQARLAWLRRVFALDAPAAT